MFVLKRFLSIVLSVVCELFKLLPLCIMIFSVISSYILFDNCFELNYFLWFLSFLIFTVIFVGSLFVCIFLYADFDWFVTPEYKTYTFTIGDRSFEVKEKNSPAGWGVAVIWMILTPIISVVRLLISLFKSIIFTDYYDDILEEFFGLFDITNIRTMGIMIISYAVLLGGQFGINNLVKQTYYPTNFAITNCRVVESNYFEDSYYLEFNASSSAIEWIAGSDGVTVCIESLSGETYETKLRQSTIPMNRSYETLSVSLVEIKNSSVWSKQCKIYLIYDEVHYSGGLGGETVTYSNDSIKFYCGTITIQA